MSSYITKFQAYLRRSDTAKGLFLVGLVIIGAITVWGGIRLALNTDYPVLVVSSGSMCQQLSDSATNQCTLAIGALIVVRGADADSIQVPPFSYSTVDCPGVSLAPQGTIIVFHRPGDPPGYLIVHRVYRASYVSGQVYYDTKGDANSCADGDQIAVSDIIGVYQFTIPIPYLGTAILNVRDFMYNPTTGEPSTQGILVIVALIVALFAFEVAEPGKKPSKPPEPAQRTAEDQTSPKAVAVLR